MTANNTCWVWQLSDYHKWFYGSAHTSGELISNLPCDEEISQGYDQHQAFHDSISWAFI